MGITYADVDLHLLDPDHEMERWLERSFHLGDLTLFAPMTFHDRDGRWVARGESLSTRIGLAQPNWHTMPPGSPKINALWWPTGASRFAFGLFLASGWMLKDILDNLTDGKADLKLANQFGADERSITAKDMYLLPPRAVGLQESTFKWSGEGDATTWLLPLVDERYWWQFKDCGDLAIESEGSLISWDDLISDLADSLEETILQSEDLTNYYKPDKEELSRKYENAAQVLDAVALSISQRVTRDLDGTVLLQAPSPSSTRLTNNLKESSSEPYLETTAGGKWDQSTGRFSPQTVRVVFRRAKSLSATVGEKLAIQDDGEVYVVDKEGSDYTERPLKDGAVQTFFSSALADFTSGFSTPDNDAALSTLADQIATDYYAWREKVFDISFSGVKPWNFTGFDDWAYWFAGYQYPSDFTGGREEHDQQNRSYASEGDYACYTRVCSMPLNAGHVEMAHAFGVNERREFIRLAKPDADVSRESQATFSIWEVDDSGSEVDTGENIEAHNWTFPKIWTGAPCSLAWHEQSQRYYVASAYSATRMKGLATDDITAAGSIDNVTALDGYYPIVNTTTTVAFANPHGFEFDDDSLLRIEWNDAEDQWEVYQGTCPA